MLSAENIEIKLYDESMHNDLVKFTELAKLDGIENNSSIEKLALRDNGGLFVIYHDGGIISMAHTHDFSEYYEGAWRIWARTATLKKYRNKGFPKIRGVVTCAGLTGHLVPYMVDYAKDHGATDILWSTNIGTNSSAKLGNQLHTFESIDPRYSWYDLNEIYYCKQDVWKLHYRDIHNMTGAL